MKKIKDPLYWLTCAILSIYYAIDPFILIMYFFLPLTMIVFTFIEKIEERIPLKNKTNDKRTLQL
jgi:hypothetical protein